MFLKRLTQMDFGPVAKLAVTHPLRVQLEESIVNYWQAAYKVDLSNRKAEKAADNSVAQLLDPKTATLLDLQNLADACVREMHRIAALPDRKTIFTLRTSPYAPFRFTDKNQKDVLLWALSHPDDATFLYEEVVVKDGDGFRVIEQKCLGIPTKDAVHREDL